MAKITVSFQKQRFSGGQVTVLIDGNRVGKIRRGETESYEVGQGSHNLKVFLSQGLVTAPMFDKIKPGSGSGIDFTLSEDEEIRFIYKVSLFNYIYGILILAVLTVFFAKDWFHIDHSIYPFLLLVVVFFILQFFTRARFLKAEELGRKIINNSVEGN
jgi:hypothetical protein